MKNHKVNVYVSYGWKFWKRKRLFSFPVEEDKPTNISFTVELLGGGK